MSDQLRQPIDAFRENCEAAERAFNASLSAPHTTEPVAAPLVGTGELVGLRLHAAEALWLRWHKEALACDELADKRTDAYNRGWYDGQAYVLRQQANWIQELCRQTGRTTLRQPEPNNRDVPTSGTNGESKT